jgi:hypothetical protein
MSLVRGRWLLIAGAALLAAWFPLQLADPPAETAPAPLIVAPRAVTLPPPIDPSPLLTSTDGAIADPAAAPLPADMATPATRAVPPPVLVGTAIAPRGSGVALLRGSDGSVQTLRVGGTIDGWRLARIGRGKVRLMRDSKTLELGLDLANRAAAGTASPASPTTPAPAAAINQDIQ